MSVPDDPLDGSPPSLDRPLPPLTWRERLDTLADATGVRPARIAIGAAAVAAAVLAVVWVMRAPPAPAELTLPYVTTTEQTGPATPASVVEDAAEPVDVVVHVAGAVTDPGVHRLDPGSRVVDAVLAAGGLAPGADEARINLASPVADGERVYVPAHGEDAPPEPVAGTTGNGASPTGPDAEQGPVVDINRASAAELEALPGVGPATAAAIVEHRARIGSFTSVDQLIEVRGIGPAKLEQLRPSARV